MKKTLTAIIPCAGEGTRMGHLTKNKHKCLLKLNKKTLLEHCISLLENNQIKDVHIICSHFKDQIKKFCKKNFKGINITFSEQINPKGVVHAIYSAKKYIKSDFILICPDSLLTESKDLRNMIKYFYDKNFDQLSAMSLEKPCQENRIFIPLNESKINDKNLFLLKCPNKKLSVEHSFGLGSIGISIFSKKCLEFLPKKYLYHDVRENIWWSNIKKNNLSQGFYLIYGQRYDFTFPEDFDKEIFLNRPKKFGVACIIKNEKNEILLQKRDHFTKIYPGYWQLFGGSNESGESPFETIIRELKEELEFDPSFITEIKNYVSNKNKHEFLFFTKTSKKISEFELNEGDDLKYVPLSDLLKYKIRDDEKPVLIKQLGL